ncbi:MAG: SET domain-containing protein [Planctomycetota bacterium]
MYEVKISAIHGRGLFAKVRIPKGTVLGKLEGELTTQDGDHVLWLDDDQGLHVQNDLKYINHASPPNAAYFDDLTVGALRDIEPGEEITHNYGGDEHVEWDGDDPSA